MAKASEVKEVSAWKWAGVIYETQEAAELAEAKHNLYEWLRKQPIVQLASNYEREQCIVALRDHLATCPDQLMSLLDRCR